MNTKTKARFSRLLRNGAGLFANEKISKVKWKKRICGEAYDINNQTIYVAPIPPKSAIESRAHYPPPEPTRGSAVWCDGTVID